MSGATRTAWIALLVAVAGSVGARLALSLGHGAAGPSLAVAALTAAWAGAVTFLLAARRWRWLWAGWLVIAHAPLLLLPGPAPAGRYVALALVVVFVLLRRQSAYRLLPPQRQAVAFYLVVLALVATLPDWSLPEATGALAGSLRNLGLLAGHALRLFWIVGLLYLLLGLRLHFLRLRPKLAVSAFMIAVVPLLLVAALLLLGAYGLMGASAAGRGLALMDYWSERADRGVDMSGVFGSPLRLDATTRRTPWQDELLSALAAGRTAAAARSAAAETVVTDSGTSRWQPADTSAYFRIGEQIWLLRLVGTDGPTPTVTAYPVDGTALDELSRLLGADVGIYGGDEITLGDDDGIAGAARRDPSRLTVRLQGELRPRDASVEGTRGLWHERLGYGATVLDVIRLSPGGLYRDSVLLHLNVRLDELLAGELSGGNEVNQALLVALAIVAGVLLLFVVVAVFLGVRITAGITGAVGTLRDGTRRLAAGDLTTRISVPGHDELGELAAGFNEMAAAVQRGREEAVARERLEREMETARAIQQRLLPAAAPETAGWQITGVSLPSRRVGGDYYDFLPLPGGRLGLAIGDVSGKGIPAALLMANLQAALHGQVLHEEGVADAVTRVNAMLARSTDPQNFATFFYGVLDQASGELTGCNAGHCPPLLVRADGEVLRLDQGGLLLGMLADRSYEEQRVALRRGDVLVLYTDGITEAAAGEDMFGEERLLQVVLRERRQPADRIRERILAAVREHAGEAPEDDLTLVVVRRDGAGAAG